LTSLGDLLNALLDGLKRHDEARDLAEKELLEHRDGLERLVEARTHSMRLAQEEAQRLNQAKSEFLAAASHDLRQPLQAISLFHAALNATPLNDEQRQLMNYLSLSLTSLGDLLNALLDISKLDAGLVKANMETVPIDWIFQKIDAEFSSLARKKRLRFKYFYPHTPLAVQTDGKLLLSMLGNLVGNAIKYTDQGGILVSMRRRGGQLLVQVWDTGIGIPDEFRQKIFDEYFQIGNRERDRAKGVGLGLSIVRRLSRLLGAEVRCHSLPGRGSIFEFSLPLADEVAAPVAAPEVPDSFDGFEGSTVMVVEDDAAVGTAIRAACEAQGMRAILHPNAESALADAEALRADYYVSDFRLPGMSGLDLLDRLQQDVGYPINAVLLTGELASTEFLKKNHKGFTVLFKPITFVKLLQAWHVQRRAGNSSQPRELVPAVADERT
ncbi:MAG: ATP-binding protein, partial [Actinomycetota bacterium]